MEKILNDKNIIDNYGEYNIPYEIAKKMDCFKYSYNYTSNFSILKNNIKDILMNYTNNNNEDEIIFDGLYEITFGNISIQLLYWGLLNGKPYFDFYFNTLDDDGECGWSGVDFVDDLTFNIDMLNNKDIFDKYMYDGMINFAKKHEIVWNVDAK